MKLKKQNTFLHDYLKPDAGFTIIELLVSVGVLTVITGAIITAFITLSSAYDRADVITKVNHEGTRVMDLLTRLVRNSSEAEMSGSNLLLTIPEDTSNIEYSSNGECSEVEIYLDSHVIKKRSDAGLCDGTPVCSNPQPCELTSDEVYVNSMNISVVESDTEPDLVTISFTLQQEQSLSDPEQQASSPFTRTVTTRGY